MSFPIWHPTFNDKLIFMFESQGRGNIEKEPPPPLENYHILFENFSESLQGLAVLVMFLIHYAHLFIIFHKIFESFCELTFCRAEVKKETFFTSSDLIKELGKTFIIPSFYLVFQIIFYSFVGFLLLMHAQGKTQIHGRPANKTNTISLNNFLHPYIFN